jgi:hypothetical protein
VPESTGAVEKLFLGGENLLTERYKHFVWKNKGGKVSFSTAPTDFDAVNKSVSISIHRN